MRRYAFILRTAARQQWVYRAELGMRAIQMVLFMGVFMALWTTAFGVSGRAELEGFSLVDMVWYLAMTETITLSSSRIFVDISEEVKAGNLAYTLARPISYPFYQVANSLGGSAPRFVLNFVVGALVVGLGMGLVGPSLGLGGESLSAGSLPGLLAFLGMAALALLLDAFIVVLIGLAAFWIEEVAPAFWIYQKLMFTIGGLFLPLEMFPEWLARAARWMPFQFITYAPARAFVDFEPEFVMRAVAGQIIYAVILAALVALVWGRARRRLVVHGG
jgi:ABC-2 type transport system permease protein